MRQAFLQSAFALKGRIFVNPTLLELGHNEYLQLVLPLYGLSNTADYWCHILAKHSMHRSKLQKSPGDLSLFYRHNGKDFCALSGNYRNDLLRAVPPAMRADLEASLRDQFKCADSIDLPPHFLGYEPTRSGTILSAALRAYVKRRKPLPFDATFF